MRFPAPASSASTGTATATPGSTNYGRVVKTLPLIGSLLRPEISPKAEEEASTDSGYGSNTGSDSHQAPAKPGGSPLLSEPSGGFELPLTKSKTVTAFNVKMDALYMKRYSDIEKPVRDLLYEYTRRRSLLRSAAPQQPMAMRPVPIGSSAREAKPYIVVFCAAGMRKRIQHFFDTNELVQGYYKPDDPLLPTFGVVVSGCAPKLRTDDAELAELIWDAHRWQAMAGQDAPNATHELLVAGPDLDASDGGAAEALHHRPAGTSTTKIQKAGEVEFIRDSGSSDAIFGIPIKCRLNDQQKNATLGGFVKLAYNDGTWKLMGLTTAHPAIACIQSEYGMGMDCIEDEDDEDDSFVDDSDSEGDEADSNRSSFSDPDTTAGKSTAALNSHGASEAWNFTNPTAFGHAFMPCLDIPERHSVSRTETSPSATKRPFFDWALVPTDGLKGNYLSSAPDMDLAAIKCRQDYAPENHDFSEEGVAIYSGSNGQQSGRLMAHSSSILISPGDEFVDAYMVELDDGARFYDGDSGSWVISPRKQELIGHIVATDVMGAGYIIPAKDIFRDIAQHEGVKEVVLPTKEEPLSELRNTVVLHVPAATSQEQPTDLLRLAGVRVEEEAAEEEDEATNEQTEEPERLQTVNTKENAATKGTDKEKKRQKKPPLSRLRKSIRGREREMKKEEERYKRQHAKLENDLEQEMMKEAKGPSKIKRMVIGGFDGVGLDTVASLIQDHHSSSASRSVGRAADRLARLQLAASGGSEVEEDSAGYGNSRKKYPDMPQDIPLIESVLPEPGSDVYDVDGGWRGRY